MLAHLALLVLSTVPTPYRPRVELWTNRGDAAVYTRGERVRVYFRLDRDAFVTIFRVDTDGRVRVLFPREPWDDSYVRGGREFEVEGRSASDAFAIDDYPGVGYLFAVTSADAFVYDAIESGDHWDYRVIADGRVRGDPYVALTDLAQRIVPEGYADWDYDIVSYNVERHYDYPRFLCYDCHSYVSWPYWDPYYYSCVRFRMVIYDDPFYYPYRYYGGTRVVFGRPYQPQPRFIFKDWGGNQPSRDRFVSRERERPVNDNTRRGVTGRDIGGIGIIPPPRSRERPGTPGQPGQPPQPDRPGHDSDADRGRGRRDQPTHPEKPETRDRADRRGEAGRPDRQPPADRPQIVPPREPVREQPRVEPRSQPRAAPRNEPRAQAPAPRAAPRREAPKAKPQSEPELRRRKP
jgi:uncharacterized protein DUF4384